MSRVYGCGTSAAAGTKVSLGTLLPQTVQWVRRQPEPKARQGSYAEIIARAAMIQFSRSHRCSRRERTRPPTRDLQISKDTDLTATEAEMAVSVPGSVFYTIFLSNISGGNILILLRRAKFQAIHTRCKGMDLDGAGTGSEQDRRAAERQHSATVKR